MTGTQEARLQAAREALAALEAAEERYLIASGWSPVGGTKGLWTRDGTRAHVARVAAYKQRQLDQAEANRTEAENGGAA